MPLAQSGRKATTSRTQPLAGPLCERSNAAISALCLAVAQSNLRVEDTAPSCKSMIGSALTLFSAAATAGPLYTRLLH